MERPDGKIIWNEACIAGLILGGISIAYTLLNLLTGRLGGILAMTVNGALWLAKFVACIWFMRFTMLQFVKKYPAADNRDTRNLGICSALLSAVIVAAVSLANTMLISPEQMQQAMDVAMSQYSNLLDSNSMAAMESMMGNFPAISFFSVLIYCFLYGTVLSMILSSDIPSKNPFDRQETDNTDNK